MASLLTKLSTLLFGFTVSAFSQSEMNQFLAEWYLNGIQSTPVQVLVAANQLNSRPVELSKYFLDNSMSSLLSSECSRLFLQAAADVSTVPHPRYDTLRKKFSQIDSFRIRATIVTATPDNLIKNTLAEIGEGNGFGIFLEALDQDGKVIGIQEVHHYAMGKQGSSSFLNSEFWMSNVDRSCQGKFATLETLGMALRNLESALVKGQSTLLVGHSRDPIPALVEPSESTRLPASH